MDTEKKENGLHAVFVYGTLKHDWMGAKIFGDRNPARTTSPFTMYGGGFPILTPDVCGHPVAGELYHVDDRTLERLDTYEGYPDFYERIVTPVIDDTGEHIAWVYIGNDAMRSIAYREKLSPNEEGFLEWR